MNFCQSEQIVTLLRQISAQLEELDKHLDAMQRNELRLALTLERQAQKKAMNKGEWQLTLHRCGVKGGSAPLSANKIPLYGDRLVIRH